MSTLPPSAAAEPAGLALPHYVNLGIHLHWIVSAASGSKCIQETMTTLPPSAEAEPEGHALRVGGPSFGFNIQGLGLMV